ncbi:adenylosuccinate synthase [uncultured Tyzzerella sp.]|uniref:adenylosuccinate synthase n=1 Tax=uncultured Tyzzerella sp. TaxID=2321398 RepID=UPI002942FA5D|nr:adenylosuccinate synthase [uncultured Tyzzerella sp.]
MVRAIVGANWGDEGKGKITDLCAEQSDIVVRFQGGSNAGHTIINQYGKFALHQLPSGVFNPNTINIIGNGVALNIEYLMEEIESVVSKGIKFNLLISDRAQVLLPHHVLLDIYEEERLGDRKFGSTKSGIAPFYADKFSKVGLQVWELYEKERLKDKLMHMYEKINIQFKHLYNKPEVNYIEVYEKLLKYADMIKENVKDTSTYLRNAIKEGKNILLEGQLGALKDTDHGIYPYVTSSSTLAGYAAVGAGIPPHSIKQITVITKAYSSAVGEGPFVSEIFEEEAEELRKRGGDSGEYGATTGRPRRVGYFDAVATRYGCEIQGATEVCITCLDVLSYMDNIKVCTGYELNGEIYKDFLTTEQLYKAKPVYQELKGWKTDIRGIKDFDALPQEAKDYVQFIEKELGVKVSMVSNGPKRDEILFR